MSRRRLAAFVLAAAVGPALIAAPASAEQVTIGPPLAAVPSFASCTTGCTFIARSLSGGALVSPPGSGRITEWSALGFGTASLRIVTLAITDIMLPAQLLAEETSTPQPLTATQTEFPTNLSVTSGDFIGITLSPGADLRSVNDPDSAANIIDGPMPDGTTAPNGATVTGRFELNAQFFFQPVVSSLGPASGRDGATVVITGDHLSDSTAVLFGTTPAPHFTIDSNTQMTATVPVAPDGTVDVTVAGPGGTSTTSAPDRYTLTSPRVGLNPGSLNFTTQPVATTSAPRTVTVTNTGTAPLTIQSVRPTLGDLADFSTPTDGCSGAIVAGGASCTVSVAFTPGAAGAKSSSLTVTDDAADSPQSLPLTGLGVAGAQHPPPDTTAPTVTGYTASTKTFRVAGAATALVGTAARAAKPRKHPAGTSLRYTLSEPAGVAIAIQQVLPGRAKGGRCVAPTAKLRKARACQRTASRGTLTRTSRAGRNTVAFSGRLGRKALAPGTYHAVLTATDSARNRSKPQTVTLTVVRT